MEYIGKKIRNLRKSKGITQEELAENFDVSSQAVSKWETGLSTPDITLLPIIARYFNISMDELFDYKLDSLTYKERFVRFMVDNGVLKFGEFNLKSGRVSPYFITTERYSSGGQLSKIGEFYAQCIRDNGIFTDLLIANTYKESHIISSIGVVMYQKFGIDINYCINNKVGKLSTSNDRITVIKDTLASGDTLRGIIKSVYDNIGIYPSNVILSVDRLEKGLYSDMNTSHEIENEFDIKVHSIVTVDDIISAIENRIIPGYEYLSAMKEYRERYRGI